MTISLKKLSILVHISAEMGDDVLLVEKNAPCSVLIAFVKCVNV